jgi:hypothetical protein
MAQHFCLKQWVNGYELSVSIDDNLCHKFRAEVALFSTETDMVKEWGSRYPISMAEDILEATKLAESMNKGNYPEFETCIRS